MKTIVIATRNKGKMEEFKLLLEPMGYEVLSMDDVAPSLTVRETGQTFQDNAFMKASALQQVTGKPVLADDSGLCVDALNGAPGVMSARFGGDSCITDADRNNHLLQMMKNVPWDKRTARFTAHLCLVKEDGSRVDFEESCEGRIGFSSNGENGFGYDPIFYVGERAFATLEPEEKIALSHRGKALAQFIAYLKENQE